MEIKRRDFLHQLGVGSVGALLANSSMSSSTAEAQEATKAPHTTGVDYQPSEVEVAGNNLFVRRYGKGPAILMIHGFPRTSLMWRDLAPKFAEDHTVICVDLRAYGQSGTPPSSDDHAPYSKRVMAAELVGLMDQLGFQTFTVVGHDRGGRVAYRMALDHPDKVERLAVFDVIPISEAWNRADGRFAKTYWPFSLLAQKAPLPEKYLLGAPEAVFGNPFGHGSFGPDILEQYVSNYRDPVRVHGICEEYRAAAGIDAQEDQADQNAKKLIHCPMLHLWAEGGPLDTLYADAGGSLGIWRAWAPAVVGHAMKGGHFFPEENPEDTSTALHEFLKA